MMAVSTAAAVATLCALGTACTALLHFAASKSQKLAATHVITLIDDLLPQTQCGECGHMGCRPYAAAIAQGEAINRCPPGGDKTIAALAYLLDRAVVPLDGTAKADRIAFIRENECIGCTKCIQACPVDAIVGAAKLMHTVITDACTGCDLCVEPCPVDCIDMLAIARKPEPARWRQRFIAHTERVQHESIEREQRRTERAQKAVTKIAEKVVLPRSKQDEIREAIARAKAKKSAAQNPAPSTVSGHDNNP